MNGDLCSKMVKPWFCVHEVQCSSYVRDVWLTNAFVSKIYEFVPRAMLSTVSLLLYLEFREIPSF